MTERSDPRRQAQPPTRVPDLALEAGLPMNVDAERTILGAILLDNQSHIEAAESIDSDDFSLDSHRRIFLRMTELMESRRSVDIVTLANELSRYKEVESVGGVAYLASLTEGLPRRPVIEEYIRIVKDKSLARRLMSICSAAIARASDQSETAIETGLAMSSQLEAAISTGIVHTAERAGDFLKRKFGSPAKMREHTKKESGIATGFRQFDEMTCGLQRGELIIIAARPSMGKTAMVCKISEHVAIDCESPTMIFSLEMSKEALLRRMVCSRARVPRKAHDEGKMTVRMSEEFDDAYAEIERSALFLDEATPKTAMQITTQARAMRRKRALDLIVVDYLGLFHHEETRRQRNATQEVGLDCYLMKMLARELEIPVIVLCQLNRETTKRTDKRPMLSDLRDSGNLEEHADLVSFLHREYYYDRSNEKLKDKGEIIISKQRNGPTGICQVAWDETLTRWSDIPDPNESQAELEYWMKP